MSVIIGWSGSGFELLEFFGEEGVKFLLVKAKVEGLDDELLEGWGDLAAAGVELEGGRLVGDEGADAAARFDKAFALKVLVDFADGQGIDLQLGGEFTDGGELGAIRDDA